MSGGEDTEAVTGDPASPDVAGSGWVVAGEEDTEAVTGDPALPDVAGEEDMDAVACGELRVSGRGWRMSLPVTGLFPATRVSSLITVCLCLLF